VALALNVRNITGLELTDMGGGVTRIISGSRCESFATTVQFDLGNERCERYLYRYDGMADSQFPINRKQC